MVDSIKGAGSVSNVAPSSKMQGAGQKRSDKAEEVAALVDEVEISQEALDLASAQKSTQAARSELESNPDVTLGLDPDFENNTA